MNGFRIRGWLFGKKSDQGLFRSMAGLALGTGMARLIGVAAMPILTRIYSPADYGVMSVYTSLITIIAPILTLRYVLAVPLPRTDAMAMNLLALSASLMLGMVIFMTALLAAFGKIWFGWMSMEVLAPWWWLVVVGGVAVAIYEAMSLWATRNRAYKIIAQTKVTQSIAGEAIKLGLGLLHFKPFGLLFGSLVGQSGGIGSFLIRFWPDFRRTACKIRRRRLLLLARRYQGFPVFRLPSQLLLVFATQAPALLSAALYGADATGQLGLALMALALPANLIGSSVGQVFYGEIARLKKGSEVRIKELATLMQKRLLMAGIIPAVVLLFFGEWIFRLAFGAKWAEAGQYASILAPYILLQLTSAPLIQILNIYNAQGAFLAINVLRTLGMIAIYMLCKSYELPLTQFVGLLGGFLFLFYLLISLYIFHVVNMAVRLRHESQNPQDTPR